MHEHTASDRQIDVNFGTEDVQCFPKADGYRHTRKDGRGVVDERKGKCGTNGTQETLEI